MSCHNCRYVKRRRCKERRAHQRSARERANAQHLGIGNACRELLSPAAAAVPRVGAFLKLSELRVRRDWGRLAAPPAAPCSALRVPAVELISCRLAYFEKTSHSNRYRTQLYSHLATPLQSLLWSHSTLTLARIVMVQHTIAAFSISFSAHTRVRTLCRRASAARICSQRASLACTQTATLSCEHVRAGREDELSTMRRHEQSE